MIVSRRNPSRRASHPHTWSLAMPLSRRNVRATLAVLTSVVILGCFDTEFPTNIRQTPVKASHVISDAAHGGAVPHFYFLPPMVATPSYAGTFDATLAVE